MIKELTPERDAFLKQLVNEMNEAITKVLSSRGLSLGEGLTVLGTSVIDILETMSNVTKYDRNTLFKVFIETMYDCSDISTVTGEDIIKLEDIFRKRSNK